MKRKVIVLIIIDQLIKYCIFLNFMTYKVKLFGGRIGFVPYLNRDQLSIFNNELNLKLSLITLILINLGVIIILMLIYKLIKKKEYTNLYFENSFFIITAGAVCSLIDKITLKGSLDYILFFRHIHDLKDIYLYIGFIFILIYMFTYLNHEKKLSI